MTDIQRLKKQTKTGTDGKGKKDDKLPPTG
jgi:hypothetical protein